MKQFCLGRLAFVSSVVILVCRSVALPGIAIAQNATALNFGLPSHGGPDGPKSIDPGPRGGPAGAGGPLAGLDADELAFFAAARAVFMETDSVSKGLGPRFNLDSCAGCHAAPEVGGSSPVMNPQFALATANKANFPFITPKGPVREARFVRNPDGSPDGGVHDLFVITGRSDAPGCNIAQPDFKTALAQNNVIFRIPTPTFGLGLVENVPDESLEAALPNSLKISFGVSGRFNRSGNDGTITRFGWKAQNKSLLIFAGEAYNVEQGVTNELFPNEREDDENCLFNGLPEDYTNPVTTRSSGNRASDYSSDVVNFAAFMRLSAPPTSASDTTFPLIPRGRTVFQNIGCNACHVMTQTTGKSAYKGQSNVSFSPFSDFALHDMGNGLADGITQGNANGREFRTAPLWGVGQRNFFLHDGRTSDLYQAIIAHASTGSEATVVISLFQMLSPTDQQALVYFLRSL
jgi:CxxC motif-containing protein (DUF1111 family)